MSTIKVGDRVKISAALDPANYKDNCGWVAEMAGFAGKVGVVEYAHSTSYLGVRVVELGDWWNFLPADLTLVPAVPEATLPTGHVHAASMLLYAQDAAETAKPWLRWEGQAEGESAWFKFDENPAWMGDYVYRRKPITIRIGQFDVFCSKPEHE